MIYLILLNDALFILDQHQCKKLINIENKQTFTSSRTMFNWFIFVVDEELLEMFEVDEINVDRIMRDEFGRYSNEYERIADDEKDMSDPWNND